MRTIARTVIGLLCICFFFDRASIASVSSLSLLLSWTKATDDVTASSDLVYEVRQSTSANIDTVANAEANGTIIQAYTADIAALNVTGLAPSTSYFFTVIVKDQAGNKAAYQMINVTTASLAGPASPAPPTITTQPANQTVTVGQAASFLISATGNPPPTYQWRKGGVNITGATSASYTTPATVAGDTGSTFDVVVTNSVGSVTSSPVTITVNLPPPRAPVITTQPSNQAVPLGQTATFSAVATGSPAPTYQWQKGRVNIAGATSSTYTTPATVAGDNGSTFGVVVSNSAGSVSSYIATLAVNLPQTPTSSFSILANGGVSLATTGADVPQTNIFYAVSSVTGSATVGAPEGVAIFGLRTGGVLVTEAGLQTSLPIASGRVYVEVGGAVDTGISVANPNDQDAVISFYFTDAAGNDSVTGSFVVVGNHQVAAFLHEAPFNLSTPIQGAFTFSSSVPVGIVALRGLTNDRGDFLVSTLPVVPVGRGFGEGNVLLPHFADGGGWTTQVVLTNPSDLPQTGTVQFFGQGSESQAAPPLNVTVNGINNSMFSYSIPHHSTVRLVTSGAGTAVQVGSVQINPDDSSSVPDALAIFSFKNNEGITISEATVPAQPPGFSFRAYVESSGVIGQIGSIQSGIAVANTTDSPVSVNIQLLALNGTSVGSLRTLTLPPGGQIAKFTGEIFPELTGPFQGILRVSETAVSLSPTPALAVIALRGRFNERADFLITTTPPLNEAFAPSPNVIFPHIVSGGGYSTQFILFGQAGPGKLDVFSQDGTLETNSVLSAQ